MTEIAAHIQKVLRQSGQKGYAGAYDALGGGENNETYICYLENGQEVVVRIARHKDTPLLAREATALKRLCLEGVPKLLYYDEAKSIENRHWIVESYVGGNTVERLNAEQYENLGHLLAQVHKIRQKAKGINLWQQFLEACQTFGDEQKVLNHPEKRLRHLIERTKEHFIAIQPLFDSVVPVLTHGDATPSNVLVDGDTIGLIDWELSRFNDPMAEFATIYYEDMEYNRGKWRTHITPVEKGALWRGYTAGGGKINTERLEAWMLFDKLGAAVFLYWRIKESGRAASPEQLRQYHDDLQSLIRSLEHAHSM